MPRRPGTYPVEYLWYAGGVPAIMLELRDLLHLDCLTVTGQDARRKSGRRRAQRILRRDAGLPAQRQSRSAKRCCGRASDPFGPEGGIAVLRGNLAPRGAVVKYFSVPDEMHVHVGPARVFDYEDAAVEALLARRIEPGDVVVIRYEGPRANGMPEMYFATAIIAADPTLSTTTAVVTDGRFSGAAKGPAVGHVTPEALEGGPIALVEEGDLIEIHIPRAVGSPSSAQRTADLRPTRSTRVLEQRRQRWSPPSTRRNEGHTLAVQPRRQWVRSRGGAHMSPLRVARVAVCGRRRPS